MMKMKKKKKKRIKVCDVGTRDSESIRQLALRLHKEGYAPAAITQALKKKFGKGVPLTLFAKGAVGGKTVKSKLSAFDTIQAKISSRVLLKANEIETTYYETGEAIERDVGPTARLFGYDNTHHFVIRRLLPFFFNNYQRVATLEAEKTAAEEAMQILMKHLGPYAKKELFRRDAFEFMTCAMMGQALGGHPVPPDTMEHYVRLIWQIDYADPDEALRDPAYWTTRWLKRMTGRR
jgi:hypothetical protein